MTRPFAALGLALVLATSAVAQDGPSTESGALLQQHGFAPPAAAPVAAPVEQIPTATEPVEDPVEAAGVGVEGEAGIIAELGRLRKDLSKMEVRLGALEGGVASAAQLVVKRPHADRSVGTKLRAELQRQARGGRQSWYGDVEVAADEVVEELLSMSGDVHVRGTVLEDAITMSGDVYIYEGGRVLGDAVSMNGDVIIESGGILQGEAHTFNGSLEVLPGGVLQRPALPDIEASTSWVGSLFMGLYRRLVFLLAFAGAGVLIVTLFQDRVGRIARYLEDEPGKAGLMGLAWTAGLMVASVLFFWTILGPLAGAAVLGLAWMLGFVGLCQMLGDRLGLRTQHHGRWITFLVGAVLISFLGALPWLGMLVVIAASIFGVGAALQTNFGSKPV